jgi:hypothetical protein
LLVVRTSVPEAAVHEDGQPHAREGDVHAHSGACDPHNVVLSKPKPSAMKGTPQPDLGPRVGASVCASDLRRVDVAWHWVWHVLPSAEVHRAGRYGVRRTLRCHTQGVYFFGVDLADEVVDETGARGEA